MPDRTAKPQSSRPDDTSIELRFDGSQKHRIELKWLLDQASKLSERPEDYAHLGLLMLKLTEERQLGPISEETLAVTFPRTESDGALPLEHLRIIADSLGLDLADFAAKAISDALQQRQREHLATLSPVDHSPDAEDTGEDAPQDIPDDLQPIDPKEEPLF